MAVIKPERCDASMDHILFIIPPIENAEIPRNKPKSSVFRKIRLDVPEFDFTEEVCYTSLTT